MFNFPEAQVRPESIHAEPFMALISLNAVLLAQHQQVLDVFAPPPKCVISLRWEQLTYAKVMFYMQSFCQLQNSHKGALRQKKKAFFFFFKYKAKARPGNSARIDIL